MKDHTKKGRRTVQIVAIVFTTMIIVLGIFTTYIFNKVTEAVLHRRNEKKIEVSLNPKEYFYEEVAFKSREDNLVLQGVFFSSKPLSNKTIILVHGFDENRLMDGRAEMLVKYFTSRGYNIFTFDLRGQGKSEGEKISFGYYEKYDVSSAIDYLKEHGKVGEKIVLLGFSMGAVTVIETAGIDERVDALIADSAFCDLKLFISNDLNNLLKDVECVSNYLGDLPNSYSINYIPYKNKIITMIARLNGLSIDKISPIRTVKNISKKPIFLIHGKQDQVIPYMNSVEIFKLLKNNSNALLWLTEKAGHIESLNVYSDEYLKKIKMFLDKNIS